MNAQDLLDRLARLQLQEQEFKTRRAGYEAEIARLQLEDAARQFQLRYPEPTPASRGAPS